MIINTNRSPLKVVTKDVKYYRESDKRKMSL